jgi:hypothetical protein
LAITVIGSAERALKGLERKRRPIAQLDRRAITDSLLQLKAFVAMVCTIIPRLGAFYSFLREDHESTPSD